MLEPGGDSSQFLLYVIVITVGLMILLAITLIAVVIMAFIRWHSRGKIEILIFFKFKFQNFHPAICYSLLLHGHQYEFV